MQWAMSDRYSLSFNIKCRRVKAAHFLLFHLLTRYGSSRAWLEAMIFLQLQQAFFNIQIAKKFRQMCHNASEATNNSDFILKKRDLASPAISC